MLKDLMTGFRERIRNPFISYFVLSWLGWNWKLVFYISFQDFPMSVTDKISYIKENFSGWGVNLFYPFLTALAVFILYQLFSIATIWFWNFMRTVHQNIETKAKKEKIITKAEYEGLKKRYYELKVELDSTKDKYAGSITALERKNLEKKLAKEKEDLEKAIDELKKKENSMRDRFEESEEKKNDLKKSNSDWEILYNVYSLFGRKEPDYKVLLPNIRKFCENYYNLGNDGTPIEIFNELKEIIDKFQKNTKYKIFDEIYRIFDHIIKEKECNEKTRKIFDIMDEYKKR